MPTLERTVVTHTGPEDVWAFLADFTTTEQWDPPTRSTVRARGDGGVGTVYDNVSSILGREVPIEYTVVDHDAPIRLQLSGHTSSMDMLDTITVTPTGDGTRVVYRVRFSPRGAAKLAIPLMPLGMKALGDTAARQMKRCLDAL